MRFIRVIFILSFSIVFFQRIFAQHNPGSDCFSCHSNFKLGGTIFVDTLGISIASGIPISLVKSDGNTITLDNSNSNGNIYSLTTQDGLYQIKIGNYLSRTWHKLPELKSCNTCHITGGNGSVTRTKLFPKLHTAIPSDNNCRGCHHFPASMNLTQLRTPSVLISAHSASTVQTSQVRILSNNFSFYPNQYSITTVRPDIFDSSYYSMFDVILAVARKNNIPIEYYFDDSCKTHFITKINNVSGNYWYHFSYDAGSGNSGEIQFKRANRWDEALWRPGVWIQVVQGENLAEIRKEYIEEIQRENSQGHLIPSVRFAINPSNYKGNPPESHRITVSKEFRNVLVTPHNWRTKEFPSPYSKPFKSGVVTSLDIPLSLMDQGLLNAVTGVFYNYFAQNYIDSYYLVELGFPGIGTVHSSGRQGIVYITENGSFNTLPNGADNKLHMTCDINVIHAPDFSYWRWIELGNPYYENQEPTKIEEELINEDYNSISRGFNLYPPYPNPFNGQVNISFNIFHPGDVNISIYNLLGEKITTLLEKTVENIGIQKLEWIPDNIPSGMYIIAMKYNNNTQERNLVYLK